MLGDTEMSVVLPALQCPVGQTEELGLEGEGGEERHSVWQEQQVKRPGGTRQCRNEAGVTGALGGTCVPGNRALEPGMCRGKGRLVLFSVSRGKQNFETVRNVMELSGVHETATYPGKRKSQLCLFYDSVKTHKLFIKMGNKTQGN